MDARIGDQAVGELEDDAAIQLDADGAVVEVLVADCHRPEGGQVQRDAADVRLVLLAVFQLLVRLQLADGLEAVADGDAVRLASSISAAIPAEGWSIPKAHSSEQPSTSSLPIFRASSRSSGTLSSMNCVR